MKLDHFCWFLIKKMFSLKSILFSSSHENDEFIVTKAWEIKKYSSCFVLYKLKERSFKVKKKTNWEDVAIPEDETKDVL